METFIFNSSDYHFKVDCLDGKSKFDRKLIDEWHSKMKLGNIFWYQLNIPNERVIDDKFLLQLNTDRANLKRPPVNIQQIQQAFNPDGFNFNKVKEAEKLFAIVHEEDVCEGMVNENVIIVNVSPLEDCHILLIPDPLLCFPQVLTEKSINLAVQLCLLSASSYFRIGFNSLGAYASVNHLHFHGYYLKREMYLELCPVKIVAGSCFSIQNYPAKGFAFQIRNEEEMCPVIKDVYSVAELLQQENIPHNLFITRGKSFTSVNVRKINDFRNCLRIYIWARKPSWGMKELSAFNIAVCELFGHMVIKNEEDYKSLVKEDIITILNDITGEPYENILPKIMIHLFKEC